MSRISIFICCVLLVLACRTREERQENGKLVVQLQHYANGQPLQFDTLKYVNAAGNAYEVSEIQWFISDVILVQADGREIADDNIQFAHYVDTDLPQTLRWEIEKPLPPGDYKAIKFTFGIKGEKNKPNMFTDLPESNMMWPMHMGGEQGGYHYMKLNGFWKNTSGERQPFNFHLGVGQERNAEDEVTSFIQNWFEIEIPAPFNLSAHQTTTVAIRMNVEKWWEAPNQYDHNVFGGSIMKNQDAMGKAVENGRNVFTFGGVMMDLKVE